MNFRLSLIKFYLKFQKIHQGVKRIQSVECMNDIQAYDIFVRLMHGAREPFICFMHLILVFML